MVSAISFGVFCRSAPSTSAIMRSRKPWPGSCVTRDLDPVGDDARARGHRRAVAARLADDGRALAGDRGLVDRGDALDDFAVGRDQVAGLDQHARRPWRSCAGGRPAPTCRRARQLLGARARPWWRAGSPPAPGRALRPAPRRRCRTARSATARRSAGAGSRCRQRLAAEDQQHGEQRATVAVTNITGFFTSCRGSSLRERVADRRHDAASAREHGVRCVHVDALLRTAGRAIIAS